ncbi:DUF4875 domain-containing protein [Photobacterium phosphoreum]|uniref:DUF4875 domain-containing protein n=1 Tax=Photobacterium phosphoreum TaxID=659 RepID=UPI0011B231F3|nr:hypothetical protein [Photobacterium phosphoreum]
MKAKYCNQCRKVIFLRLKCCSLCHPTHETLHKNLNVIVSCVFFTLLAISAFYIINNNDPDNRQISEQRTKVLPSLSMIKNDRLLKNLITQHNLVKTYIVTGVDDLSFDDRRRVEIWIMADRMNTLTEKLATAALAATEQLEKYNVQFITVMLDQQTEDIDNAISIDYAQDYKDASGNDMGVNFVLHKLPPEYTVN